MSRTLGFNTGEMNLGEEGLVKARVFPNAKVGDEARTYFTESSNLNGTVVAVGLVSNSFLGKMIGNFFLTLNQPKDWPMKFFSSPIAAEHWVRTQMKGHANNAPFHSGQNVA